MHIRYLLSVSIHWVLTAPIYVQCGFTAAQKGPDHTELVALKQSLLDKQCVAPVENVVSEFDCHMIFVFIFP